MSYQLEIDRTTAADWSRLIEEFDDASIYQTWPYGEIRWGRRQLSHLVLKRDGAVVAMAQLRIVGSRHLKCGIAHLRWGPLCQRKGAELDSEVLREAARALEAEYVERRRLFLRILPNAFDGSPRAVAHRSAFAGFSSEPATGPDGYRTLVLDLSPSLEELRRRLNQKWRNQLNRAEKNDLKVVEGDGHELFQLFVSLYREMWSRKRFETAVDVDEFARIQQMLPSQLRMRVLVCFENERPVAGSVYSAIGSSGVYLLGATTDAGMKSKGAYLLQWTMVRRLKEQGIRFYDLGGIDPEANPGVHHFKSGLSGSDLSHIGPLIACRNPLSRALVRVADRLRGPLRGRSPVAGA
jgi:hypothetical protein